MMSSSSNDGVAGLSHAARVRQRCRQDPARAVAMDILKRVTWGGGSAQKRVKAVVSSMALLSKDARGELE